MPVLSADVASVVCGDTTGVDDDAENHEADTREDLDEGEHEFDLFTSCQSLLLVLVSLLFAFCFFIPPPPFFLFPFWEILLFPLSVPLDSSLLMQRQTIHTHLSITPDTEELNGNQSNQQGHNPGAVVDTFGARPIMDDVAGGGDFEWKHGQPADCILPPAYYLVNVGNLFCSALYTNKQSPNYVVIRSSANRSFVISRRLRVVEVL